MKKDTMRDETLVKQSKTAYAQWSEQWRAHAKEHSQYPQLSLSKFENSGIGKSLLLVANGFSLEENIETIKKNQKNVDILCCDKTLGHLLDNDIIPQFCVVCDANVNYEKYLEKYKDKLQDTILFINVCGNPKWTKFGNWKDVYFFINKDVIESEKEFSKISGCNNFIAAGTNVSNAMVILVTQSDNEGRKNFFGYDKYLLIGYDYSWKSGGKYYAFDQDGGGKEQYMKHLYFNLQSGKIAYSSGNLIFSRDWLTKYIQAFNLPIVQCNKDSLLQLKASGDLDYQMQYGYKKEDAREMKELVSEFDLIRKKYNLIKNKMQEISKDHWLNFQKSI
jgi:hypothetical protein